MFRSVYRNANIVAHVQARAAASAAAQEMARSRREFQARSRPAVHRIQIFAATDGQRGPLGITIPDRTRTPIGPPTCRPLAKVDFSKRLSHRIAFVDERKPLRRTKPKGILGAEPWVKLTALGVTPPTGSADLSFLMLSSRPPAVAEYGGANAGKTAHYMA